MSATLTPLRSAPADHPALAMRADLKDRETLLARYRSVRTLTSALTRDLTPEDMVLQSMPDASPAKWHLAHTTWFFETFLLSPHGGAYTPFHPRYNFLFNSYYEAVGARWARPDRGLLSRPTTEDIMAYRAHVDAAMISLMESAGADLWPAIAPLIDLGLHHEQQHQELLCTDIKHALALSPLFPAAIVPDEPHTPSSGEALALTWSGYDGALRHLGGLPDEGFHFDNELPNHTTFLHGFSLASRLVTNAEFAAFIADGGYRDPRLWLSDGWATVSAQGWEAPIYWRRSEELGPDTPAGAGEWCEVTLHGLEALDPAAPAAHISAYEAAAFAVWAGAQWPGARLPREGELEWVLSQADPAGGRFLTAGTRVHPQPAQAHNGAQADDGGPAQLYGELWEWTQSPYTAYPGYYPPSGAVGEYNGKFMCNQLVLKGGSCATPPGHIRATYRNFWPPHTRWQFAGLRLARDA